MGLFNYMFGIAGVEVEPNTEITISGIPTKSLRYYIKKMYGSGPSFLDYFAVRTWTRSIRIKPFFIPELVYLYKDGMNLGYFSKFTTTKIINLIYEKTWFGSTLQEPIVDIDYEGMLKQIQITPTNIQEEFIREIYCQKKIQYQLNGYLLSFDQGLGKSMTSMMLATATKKKHMVIICPLSTVKNVWIKEVDKLFKVKKNVWDVSMDPAKLKSNTDVVILNYEAIGKIAPYLLKTFNFDETMIIVDECHNFKDYKSKRTNELISLCKDSNCRDILLMSGTPIKALGVECIPIFKAIDSYFTPDIELSISKLTRYTAIMNDLLRNRLGMMMFRKLKKDVLALPEKHEEDLLIKIPNGDDYKLENVQKLVVEFAAERRKYYTEHYRKYEFLYYECLREFEKTLSKDEWIDYKVYLKNIEIIKKTGYGRENIQFVIAANKYEKEIIIPRLPVKMRADFRSSKSVVKYVELKILGEILGGLLNTLRTEMSTAMIGDEVINIINNADKKTILFSSYTDTIQIADEVCRRNGLKPICITGENTKEASALLEQFKKDPTINPLIASIKVMSTGHTIIEANTVIFLNVPFRSVDYDQASDRVYRIGQDVAVWIYKLLLDTRPDANLSTRMHDIISWSKEQFNTIVGDDDSDVDQSTKSIIKGFMHDDLDFTKTVKAKYDNVIDTFFANIKNLFSK